MYIATELKVNFILFSLLMYYRLGMFSQSDSLLGINKFVHM